MKREIQKKRFLPESLSAALKKLGLRIGGLALFLAGAGFALALVFHNPNLDGFGASSGFGAQSWIGNIIGALRFAVGFVPALFLFLCVARSGMSLLMKWDEERAPEYNMLRAFIAVCFGAAGFGAIARNLSFGGIAGAVAASDISYLAGGWTFIFGILFLIVFFWIAGTILHISLRDLRIAVALVHRVLRWVLSALHLVKMAEPEEYEEIEEAVPKAKGKRQKAKAEEAKPVSQKRATAHSSQSSVYTLPPPEFLEKSIFSKTLVTNELKRNGDALEAHFEEFGVYGKVAGIKPGPIVTLYEFEPDSGMRIAKITDTVKDMTRAMAAENIRIAHIPRSNFIGVEMVNLNRQTVRFQSLVSSSAFTESKYRIPLALGVDIGGNPVYFDLAKMPHALVAGRTGSGKSVFVQSIIMSIVYHFTPDKCKMIIVDPKGVDFTLWQDIPHLVTPVVTDANQAVNALKWAVREMEDRYNRLKDIGVQNLEGYNEAVQKMRAKGEKLTKQIAVGTDPETGALEFEDKEIDLSDMPYLVIIIDEVADLMSVARKEVEACVQRLAQKARAAGMHIVAATQRPDTSVITGVIKANFPTRISFQARSNIDSMTTLGEKGAEQLLPFGDMLFSEAGRVPVRIHGALLENTEINRVADFLRAEGAPEYIAGALEGDGDGAAAGGFSGMPGAIDVSGIPGMSSGKDAKDAENYRLAVEYVVKDKKPTISYIQRRLGIGYNKAAGFIERMEREGIVSGPDANNKRHIL